MSVHRTAAASARGLAWSIAIALCVVAAGVLVLTVQVRAGGESRSCGSAWDVVSGRSGWQHWWALDLTDATPGAPMLRTVKCPDAVNAHVVAAAALGVGAVVAFAAAAFLGPYRRIAERPAGPTRRLQALGATITLLGVVLTGAGLAGLALLVADPNAALFLYVSRSTVVLLGLLLLLPAVLLIALGRGASVLAEQLGRDEMRDEPA